MAKDKSRSGMAKLRDFWQRTSDGLNAEQLWAQFPAGNSQQPNSLFGRNRTQSARRVVGAKRSPLEEMLAFGKRDAKARGLKPSDVAKAIADVRFENTKRGH
jgi:hypothetical protein